MNKKNSYDLKKILNSFEIEDEIVPYGNGHINDTYLSDPTPYIVQRVNTSIFKDADGLMENIENVTAFLRNKVVENGGNPKRETLTVIKTKDGKNYYRDDDGNVFRVYYYIQNTITIENDKTLHDVYNAGKGFGRFAKLLNDYPAQTLHETIADFHHTPKRVDNLRKAVEANKAGRAHLVQDEINYVLSNADFASQVVNGIESGDIPLRVTHNDTKINNILFDEKTREAVCVIDLDTVMPGSMLYDFGDSLRMGASTAAEDETDLDKVHFDVEAFRAFAKGYLGEMKDVLTPAEIALIPMSVRLMTFECGTRFLTDYLDGDVYFKIHRENHNLDRARNQFKLCREMAEKEEELKKIVKELVQA